MGTAFERSSSWLSLPVIDEDFFSDTTNKSMHPNTDSHCTKSQPKTDDFADDGFQSASSLSPLSTNGTISLSSSSTSKASNNAYDDASYEARAPNRDALTKKLERDTNAPTVCVVCASPASCFHYKVATCNACKTYFRRHVISGRNHACKFDGRCDIREGARCRSCRFDRCLLAGMDASGIKFADPETRLAVLNEVNRRKRNLKPGSDEGASTSAPTREEALALRAKITPRFEQTSDARVVDFLTYMERKFCRLRESTFNDQAYYRLNVPEVLRQRCALGEADKHERPKDWPLPSDFVSRARDEYDLASPRGRHWLAFDLLLCVDNLKALPFFYRLDFADQEALAIHVVLVNTVLVESWYSYAINSHILMLPGGISPLQMRYYYPLSKKYPEAIPLELDAFVHNIDPLFRVAPEHEEYCLLKAIIFSHSATPGLSAHAQAILDEHRELYASTLLRRSQARLGSMEGARKYADLITLVESFFQFAQKKRQFHIFIEQFNLLEAGQTYEEPPFIHQFLKNSSACN